MTESKMNCAVFNTTQYKNMNLQLLQSRYIDWTLGGSMELLSVKDKPCDITSGDISRFPIFLHVSLGLYKLTSLFIHEK